MMPNSGRGQAGARGFWLLGGIVVVAAVVIVGYFGMSERLPGDDAAGAIGAAKKHIEEQMGDDDVVLAETQVHEFMQSETFQKMVDDADFRKAVLDNYLELAVQRALGTPEYRELPPQAQDPLQRPVFRDPGPMTPGNVEDILALASSTEPQMKNLDEGALKRLGEIVRGLEAPGRSGDVKAELVRRMGADDVLSRHFDAGTMNRIAASIERALEMPEYRELPPQAHDPLQRPPVFRDPGPMTPGAIGDVIAQLEIQARSASKKDAEALHRLLENPNFTRMMEHPGFVWALESRAITNRLEQLASIQ